MSNFIGNIYIIYKNSYPNLNYIRILIYMHISYVSIHTHTFTYTLTYTYPHIHIYRYFSRIVNFTNDIQSNDAESLFVEALDNLSLVIGSDEVITSASICF